MTGPTVYSIYSWVFISLAPFTSCEVHPAVNMARNHQEENVSLQGGEGRGEEEREKVFWTRVLLPRAGLSTELAEFPKDALG